MISTIRTWIYRIQNFEKREYTIEVLSRNQEELLVDAERKRKHISKLREEKKTLQDEMKRLVSLLSGDTWKEWDNMMEAIEAYQQTKYLKEHAEDFLMIMTQNAPEVAAQELFEYFELEVPDSTNIEIETAKKLYDLWNMAGSETALFPDVDFEDLDEKQKQFFIQEVYKLWNR